MSALKAFVVLENYENTGGIVFAKHNVTARRLGANEYADGDFLSVECRRAPWADKFAERLSVPASEMIEHGWNFECSGCGARIDEDFLYENKLPVEGVIGSESGAVYCCARCKWRSMRERADRAKHEKMAIDAYKAEVLKRFPDAEFCEPRAGELRPHHAYTVRTRGDVHWQQVVISFNFPGMKIGPAHYRRDEPYSHRFDWIGPVKPYFTCCNGDKEAFEKYAAETGKTL